MTMPTTTADTTTTPLTETGAAERFALLYGDNWRHDHRRNRDLRWSGDYWQSDTDGALTRDVIDFARHWQAEALTLPTADERKAAVNFAIGLERRDRQRNMLAIARDLLPIADAGDDWDTRAHLLGTPAGVVDLRTGELRRGRRDDRITMTTRIDFDPSATSSCWNAALAEILPDENLRDYLQLALGYSTTGETMQDCWFLAQGSGRNGKGTVFSPVARALGDYAGELPASAIALDRSRHPYELANLPGKRFVLSSEAGDSITLHHDRLKQLTGGDRLTADGKYQQPITFRPQCKLWLSANPKPRVTDDSPAFWARVRFLPFSQSFLGRENPDLRRSLEEDPEHQRAILAWLIAGAVRYYAAGLATPETIRVATAKYEHDSDPLAEWIADAMVLDPCASIGASDAYQSYSAWATRAGVKDRDRLSLKTFGEKMPLRGFERKHTRDGNVYRGIGRRDDASS